MSRGTQVPTCAGQSIMKNSNACGLKESGLSPHTEARLMEALNFGYQKG